jgi:hypothetical protein
MYVNGMGASGPGLIKMSATGTLFKTVLKRLLEDDTFLIAFDATTIAAYAFFLITSSASTNRTLAQDTLSEMLYRIRIKPFCNGGSGNVVTVVVIEFVRLLTTDAQATIPIDV